MYVLVILESVLMHFPHCGVHKHLSENWNKLPPWPGPSQMLHAATVTSCGQNMNGMNMHVDGGLFLKCTCIFWSLIWVVSVLVCLRTPGMIGLHRSPHRHGALDGVVDGGCGKSVLLFSVQACGKPWTWLFPVSLSWCFRSGPCGPMTWERDFSPVHLVTFL